MIEYASLCVKYNLWIISDEAYRELAYEKGKETSSIWTLTNGMYQVSKAVVLVLKRPLRFGMLVAFALAPSLQTMHCAMKNLLLNIRRISVLIRLVNIFFGALAHESHAELHNWYEQQRDYYREMIYELHKGFKEVEPDFIISNPEASIYFVIDVRNVAKPGFDGVEFCCLVC